MKKDIYVNKHEYDNESVYVTIGLNIGMLVDCYLVNGKKEKNRLSFANLFSKYMKKQSEIPISVIVDRTVTYISFKSTTNEYLNSLKKVFYTMFEAEIEKSFFEEIKEKTIEDFGNAYKNAEFRGIYKAFEFSDFNKGYLLKNLVDDIQKISFEEFVNSRKLFVVVNNCNIFINGMVDDDKLQMIDEALQNSVESENEKINEITFLNVVNDPYLRQDGHLVEYSKTENNIDVLALEFPKFTNPIAKYIYMDIESRKINTDDKYVNIDKMDSSIVINHADVKSYKRLFKNISREEKFNENKYKAVMLYKGLYNNNPEEFGNKYIEFMFNKVDLFDYIEKLDNIDYEKYCILAKEIKPIVCEGQIIMRS